MVVVVLGANGLCRCFAVQVDVVVGVIVVNADPTSGPGLPDPPEASKGAAEHQDPPAPKPKISALTEQLDQDPGTERHKRGTNNPSHPNVDPFGEGRSEHDGKTTEDHDNNAMADCVHRGKKDALPACLGGAAEVSDGCDVIPVDAVPKAEAERGEQQSDGHVVSLCIV